jgi:hypothetical protein
LQLWLSKVSTPFFCPFLGLVSSRVDPSLASSFSNDDSGFDRFLLSPRSPPSSPALPSPALSLLTDDYDEMGKIRMLGVVMLSIMATSLLLFRFVRRSDGTLLPFGDSGEDDGWVEYGSDGTCLSLGAYVDGEGRLRARASFVWLLKASLSPWLSQQLFLSPLAKPTADERRAAYAYDDTTNNASTSTPSHPSPPGTLAYLFSSFLPPLTSPSEAPSTLPSSELPVNPTLGLLAEGERKWGDLMSRQSRR